MSLGKLVKGKLLEFVCPYTFDGDVVVVNWKEKLRCATV